MIFFFVIWVCLDIGMMFVMDVCFKFVLYFFCMFYFINKFMKRVVVLFIYFLFIVVVLFVVLICYFKVYCVVCRYVILVCLNIVGVLF